MVKTTPYKAGECGLIPGWGVKSPHASGLENQNIKKKKKKQYCNKFKKDFFTLFKKELTMNGFWMLWCPGHPLF